MEHIRCNLCGSSETEFVYEQPDLTYSVNNKRLFRVVRCKDCGLSFLNPMPDVKEMQKYYPSQFYHSFSDEKALKRYKEEAKYLLDLLPGKLLDIGCANGDFPLYMKRKGWDTWGTETGLQADIIKILPICRKNLPECEFKPDFFDAITAWAVFEHLQDPLSYFKEVSRILKPGGHFIFLVTNFNSLSSSKLFHEDIPRHLYFFSESTIKLYLKKSGLVLNRIEFCDKIYSMSYKGVLIYFLKRLLGKQYTWQDSTFCRREWLLTTGRKSSLLTNLLFLILHPIYCLDVAVISRIAETMAVLKRNYGIMVVVAGKQ